MIGKISNITPFGLFISFTEPSSEKKRIGLMRWSTIAKNLPSFQIGDWIGFEITKIHEDGKMDLNYAEKEFTSTYGTFLKSLKDQLETIHKLNEEIK
ncbi:RNA-binding protein [Lactococcus hircilactis]|uniref:RNA-binding protein n=1 Tax=Lactococcus hircilactis TaxID=1494462 RepID=A0A7X1Z9F4_9LACT|nr:RNA-binding protein [Lactococcus hircilactis]MQW39679.1 RNA-binding protein [Lactococcus hircilactis]